METRQVVWKGKFDGRPVTINAVDFDPKIHTSWDGEAEEPKKGSKKKGDAE